MFVSVEGGDVFRFDIPKSQGQMYTLQYGDVNASLMKTDYTPYYLTMLPVAVAQHQTKAKTTKMRLGKAAAVHHTSYKPTFLALTHDRRLKVYSMSDEYVGDPTSMDDADVAPADIEHNGHDKAGGVMCVSNDQSMLATGGHDGVVRVYRIDELSRPLYSVRVHDPYHVCIDVYIMTHRMVYLDCHLSIMIRTWCRVEVMVSSLCCLYLPLAIVQQTRHLNKLIL